MCAFIIYSRGKVKKKTSKHRVVDQAGNVTETTTTIRSIVPERAVQPRKLEFLYFISIVFISIFLRCTTWSIHTSNAAQAISTTR